MLNWLKNYAFLAAWLSPLIALIGMMFRTPRSAGGSVDWSRIMMYVTVLTCLAVAISPGFDEGTKLFVRGLVYFGIGFILVDRKPRA